MINAAAQPGGGDAGSIAVSASYGSFISSGTMLGKGGLGGKDGLFVLDTSTLSSTASLSASLAKASLDESQTIRARNGDVLLDGASKAHKFELSADQGTITVTGEIDASGSTGGAISLMANGSVVLDKTARLTAAGRDFSNAGKGGNN